MSTQINRGRAMLIVLVVLFGLPSAIAVLGYRGLGWRGNGDAAAGQLIDPAQSVTRVELSTLDGDPADSSIQALSGHWTILQFASGGCGAPCRRRLVATRQARALLHIDAPRVQRLLIIGDNTRLSNRPAQPDLTIYRSQVEPWRSRLRSFGVRLDETVWLVDPEGRMMAYYSAPRIDEALHHDLSRLLSQPHPDRAHRANQIRESL